MIVPFNHPLWPRIDRLLDADQETDDDALRFTVDVCPAPTSPVGGILGSVGGPRIHVAASPTQMILPIHISESSGAYEEAPTVSTPGAPRSLRPPTDRSRLFSSILAPEIPSPIDTPPTYTVGLAARDDPATPVPLGEASFAKFREKKDYKAVSKHFASFEKGIAKGLKRNTTKTLDGCRICLPVDKIAVSKHQPRWEIIASLGGKVLIQPDSAVTHVVYDGSSAGQLAQSLGLESVDDLPSGVICVKWTWIWQCKLAGRRLDPTPWLSFRDFPTTRVASKLRENSIHIRKRRNHTASDSETESSKRERPYTARPIPTALEEPVGPARSAVQAVAPRSETELPRMKDNRTVHDAATGPGWVEREQDGLDVVISGVQSGDADESDDENPNPIANRFKCGQSHNGSSSAPNEWLALKFDEMYNMYTGAKHKNTFQLRGYMLAAAAIRRTPWPIQSGAEASRIKGIGDGMQQRIDEFLDGRPGRLFYENDEQMRATQEFFGIYGVGKHQAHELYRKGARSIADLAAEGNPFNLNEGQQIGLSLYDDLNTRIPRAECKEIQDVVKAEAEAIDPKIWIEIMGSYRRGQETSGDVDFLITRDPADGQTHANVLKGLVSKLTAKGFITHELSRPHDWHELEAKWMGICRLGEGLHRRIGKSHLGQLIDILCIPFESWGAALIYFTGNDIFNRSMRLYARKLGYSLNQRGLSAGVSRARDGTKETEGVIVASRTEQEIFDRLGLRMRPPHQRRP